MPAVSKGFASGCLHTSKFRTAQPLVCHWAEFMVLWCLPGPCSHCIEAVGHRRTVGQGGQWQRGDRWCAATHGGWCEQHPKNTRHCILRSRSQGTREIPLRLTDWLQNLQAVRFCSFMMESTLFMRRFWSCLTGKAAPFFLQVNQEKMVHRQQK